MSLDLPKLEKDLLEALIDLGKDIKGGLWNEENRKFLEIISHDIASLAMKLVSTDDEAKKQRYRRSIDLSRNHIAVMAFSRLSVTESEARDIVSRLLHRTVAQLIESVLRAAGVD